MSAIIVAEKNRGQAAGKPDDHPKRGEWYWVKFWEWKEPTCWSGTRHISGTGPRHLGKEELMCVVHVGSNFVAFGDTSANLENADRVPNAELLARTRKEENAHAIIDGWVEETRSKLHTTLKLLAEKMNTAGLIGEENAAPTSLLPSLTRRDPNQHKKELTLLRDKTLPATKERVKELTSHMVTLQKMKFMSERSEMYALSRAVTKADERIFALEMYAGLAEKVKQIGDGQPAPANTPITVRQMLRYMDEETLFDLDKGGMDFEKLGDFDEWIAKPENRDRLVPEPRCLVSFKVRRHDKDYGPCRTLSDFMCQLGKREANMKTYLVMRNGEKIYRLASEAEFEPRLIPLMDEFTPEQLTHKGRWFDDPVELVTPQHVRYDDKIEELRSSMMRYNRVMFLLQGLLDRSEVYSPHPPINLGDDDSLNQWLRLLRDEEQGLPSWNPPEWESYRDAANAKIQKGTWVYCNVREEDREMYNWRGSWKKRPHDVERPFVCQVHAISPSKSEVVLRWSLGNRIKDEWVIDKSRPVPNKPGYYYQKKIEYDLGERFARQRVKIAECFNVEAYQLGEYKKFLCDAYLKGRYLQWAPHLIAAEKFHQKLRETKSI